jgi:hypothetical protein
MTLRPSSLPMLAQCPCFEAGDTSVYAEDGQKRHEALAEIFRNEGTVLDGADAEPVQTLLDSLDDESREGIEWAADYIRVKAPMSDYPLRIEEHVNPLGPDFAPLFENGGTRDYACGPHVFDFKWRERDYTAQLAAYALASFEEGHPVVWLHSLFGATRRARVAKLDEQSARALVDGIIASARNPDAQPTPCDYCGWCAKRLTCKPYTRTAKRVAEGYADESLLAQVQSWHPSDAKSADEIALMLTIARRLLAPWCKSVEFHAREAALKDGLQLPGYELKEKRGKSFVADVPRAHELLGLPAADVLRCCELRLNTSKKNPDKQGVIDIYAKVHEMKAAPAKRAVRQKLAEVITTGKPTMSLVAVGGEGEAENEE